ncbi:MAG: Lipoyl synthase [Bacteroidetes bacterium 38_7]|nr:MAG: Lipoyl synthase [Bacteroidetes bacterium 38_7]HAL65288.1 lipoyl synthase [Bacteroidales bacterium]
MEDYRQPKPEWIKVHIKRDEKYQQTASLLKSYFLNTICSSGKCPNIKECWKEGTATFMILGEICTRACKFCNTATGKPMPPDPDEPERLAKAALEMGLQYIVLTSVDRDDLEDLGINHWVRTINTIREYSPQAQIEVLIPDFQGRENLIQSIINLKPNVIGHNLETVQRLTPAIRSRARYHISLEVIRQIAKSGIPAKSGIMVGLGESYDEILQTMDDLIAAGCSILTIGQYLRPSPRHYPVMEYIRPEIFSELRKIALEKGFKAAECGPLVRSSYHAAQYKI